MLEVISLSAVVLISLFVACSLPLLCLAYYRLRLGHRRQNLQTKIREFGLEGEYLQVFVGSARKQLPDKSLSGAIPIDFTQAFEQQFHGDNSLENYVLPLLLTAGTTVLFALVVLGSLLSINPFRALVVDPNESLGFLKEFPESNALPFAVAGALLYVFPIYLGRYASFSLNPINLMDLLWKFWLSALLGVAFAFAAAPLANITATLLPPIAAFLGALVPLATLDWLKKRAFGSPTNADQGEAIRRSTMLEILDQDEELFSQLNYIGVRSVLELAYENPLKIFVETDLNLETCVYLVDKANLYLYVPDKDIRKNLSHFGIKTAIDLMTQVYKGDALQRESVYIPPDKPLPDQLAQPLTEIAKAMTLESVDGLRNLLDEMNYDPELTYLLDFWRTVRPHIERLSTLSPAPHDAA